MNNVEKKWEGLKHLKQIEGMLINKSQRGFPFNLQDILQELNSPNSYLPEMLETSTEFKIEVNQTRMIAKFERSTLIDRTFYIDINYQLRLWIYEMIPDWMLELKVESFDYFTKDDDLKIIIKVY